MIVRGGGLDLDILRADAERYHSIYGVYGLSVFAAGDVGVDELAQRAPLVRFGVLTLLRAGVLRAGVLRAAGFRIEPTGRNPRHFTVAFDALETGVEALCNCEHRSWENPYHEN